MAYNGTSRRDLPQPMYANDAIVNPVVPFIVDLQRQLTIGEIIILEGFLPPKSSGFTLSINRTRRRSQPEQLMSINIRLQDLSCTVVRNSYLDDAFGNAEVDGGTRALKRNGKVRMLVMVTKMCFKISFNGAHFCNFKHRRHYTAANQINIEGNIEVDSMSFQLPVSVSVRCLPPSMPVLPESDDRFEDAVCRKLNETDPLFPARYGWEVPFYEHIEGGMTEGRFLYLSARPFTESKGFVINFRRHMSGSRSEKDIALHMSVALSSKSQLVDRSDVVLNSKHKSKWGPEVKLREVPFKPGQHFDLVILCDRGDFKLSVNNRHMAQFTHRFADLNNITDLDIRGDLKIVHIRLS